MVASNIESATAIIRAWAHDLNLARDSQNRIATTFSEWNVDDAPRLAAATAYYTALSIAPLLVLIIIVVGLIHNESSVQDQIVHQVGPSVGPTAANLVQSLITSASNFGSGVFPRSLAS